MEGFNVTYNSNCISQPCSKQPGIREFISESVGLIIDNKTLIKFRIYNCSYYFFFFNLILEDRNCCLYGSVGNGKFLVENRILVTFDLQKKKKSYI